MNPICGSEFSFEITKLSQKLKLVVEKNFMNVLMIQVWSMKNLLLFCTVSFKLNKKEEV
jgi:hypothetical protein